MLLQWKGKYNYPSKDLNAEGQWGQERIQHCCPLFLKLLKTRKKKRRKGRKQLSFSPTKPLSLQGKQRIEWVPERCFLLLWHFKTTLNLQQWVLGGAKVAVWLRKWEIVKGKGELWLPPAPSYQLKATQREICRKQGLKYITPPQNLLVWNNNITLLMNMQCGQGSVGSPAPF